MDLAATVARYEQALRTNKPFAFRLYSAFPWESTEGTDLIQEKLFFLVGMNKAYNFPELQTPFDMDLRAQVEHQNQILEEVRRYDRAFRAMHPDLIETYEIMRNNMTLEEKLEQLKSVDMGFNFMAEYEMQQELERLRLEESFEQLERAVMAENEFLEELHRLQMGSDVTGPAHNDH